MAKFILSGFADEADKNLDGQIVALMKAGIDFVEMRGVDGSSLIDCSDEKVLEIKEKLDKNNIKLSAVGSYIGKIQITDAFEPHLEKFKRAVEIAKMLGTKKIRIFSFYMPKGENPSSYLDEVIARLKAFLDAAEGSGVDCCLENEKDLYGDTPERMMDLFEALGPRLKGIFDPANYLQSGVKDTVAAFKKLLPYTDYMHIKDAKIKDGHVVPAGMGDGKISELIQMFSQVEGERFLSIEPHLKVFDGFQNLGDDSSIKEEFVFESGTEAFLAAANALKVILNNQGGKF